MSNFKEVNSQNVTTGKVPSNKYTYITKRYDVMYDIYLFLTSKLFRFDMHYVSYIKHLTKKLTYNWPQHRQISGICKTENLPE